MFRPILNSYDMLYLKRNFEELCKDGSLLELTTEIQRMNEWMKHVNDVMIKEHGKRMRKFNIPMYPKFTPIDFNWAENTREGLVEEVKRLNDMLYQQHMDWQKCMNDVHWLFK